MSQQAKVKARAKLDPWRSPERNPHRRRDEPLLLQDGQATPNEMDGVWASISGNEDDVSAPQGNAVDVIAPVDAVRGQGDNPTQGITGPINEPDEARSSSPPAQTSVRPRAVSPPVADAIVGTITVETNSYHSQNVDSSFARFAEGRAWERERRRRADGEAAPAGTDVEPLAGGESQTDGRAELSEAEATNELTPKEPTPSVAVDPTDDVNDDSGEEGDAEQDHGATTTDHNARPNPDEEGCDDEASPPPEDSAGVDPGDSRAMEDELEQLITRLADEMSDLAFVKVLPRAKVLHEALHPDTKHGGSRDQVPENGTCPSFVQMIASRTGKSSSTLYNRLAQAAKLATLDPAAEALCYGTPLANKVGLVVRIARIPRPKLQSAVVSTYRNVGPKRAKKELVECEKDFGLTIARKAKPTKHTSDPAKPTSDPKNDPPPPNPSSPPANGEETRTDQACRIHLRRDGTPVVVPGLGTVRLVEETDADFVVEIAEAPAPTSTRPGPRKRPGRTTRVKDSPASDATATPVLDPAPEGATDIIQFTAELAALTEAIRVVGLVEPGAVTADGHSAYLFHVGGDGICSLYSRGAERMVRARLTVREVVGEGCFAYPAVYLASLKQPKGTAAIRSYKADDGKFRVQHAMSTGASGMYGTVDPRLLHGFDDLLDQVLTIVTIRRNSIVTR